MRSGRSAISKRAQGSRDTTKEGSIVDNEELRQWRDVSGEEIYTCDLCGQPISHAAQMRLSGKEAMAEPVEQLSLCASCLAAVERDDVPIEEEAGDVFQVPSPDER